MEYRNMGHCGLKLSVLSFGAWATFGDQIDPRMARDLIHQAYDAGINFFDNADIYANGKARMSWGQPQGSCRESLVISSKVFWRMMPGPNGNRGHTR